MRNKPKTKAPATRGTPTRNYAEQDISDLHSEIDATRALDELRGQLDVIEALLAGAVDRVDSIPHIADR